MRTLACAALLSIAACNGSSAEQQPPPAAASMGWTGLAACKHESYVYAVGQAPDGMLGASSAGQRARVKLLGPALPADGSKITLHESEVLDSHSDGTNVFALARTVDPAIDRKSLPDCDAAALAWKSPDRGSCPSWTRKIAWIEGGRRHGVGLAKGMNNVSLAANTAQNRARSEIQKLGEVQLGGGGSSMSSSGETDGTQIVEQTSCDGATYVHVIL